MNKLSDIIKPKKTSVDLGKLKSAAGAAKKAGSDLVKSAGAGAAKAKEFLSSKTPIAYIVMGLLFIILILLIIYLTQNLIAWAYANLSKKSTLLNGTKDASMSEIVITQDPNVDGAITLKRSNNEDGGIEFTYSFWLYVNDWVSSTPDKEQHVFHKGEKDGLINFAPKVTLDGKNNTMYIYMNTFNTQRVKVNIDNLPVKKWINVCLVVQHKVMDIYVNGFLKRTYTFDSLPKQNYRKVWINRNGGFKGYFSSLVYYRYALNYFDVQNIMNSGPSPVLIEDVSQSFQQIPPYFSSNWWTE